MRTWPVCLLVLAACSTTVEAPTTDSQVTPSALTTVVTTVVTSVVATEVSPTVASAQTSGDATTTPDGFETTMARVTEPDGAICEICVWVADTDDRRRRGLMFVTDLGPADAMAFVYPDPHTGTFWMKDTTLPLSIAFVSPTGEFMQSFDMEPCRTQTCLSYRTPADFLVAIETPKGRLESLGLVVGSTFELLDVPCDA